MSNKSQADTKNRFESGIGPMTDRVLNTLLDKLTSNNFREKIAEKVLDPITAIINQRIQPYIYIMAALYGAIVILLIVIIVLLVIKHRK